MKEEVEEIKAGDAWKEYIQQFPTLNTFWNNLPEATSLWLAQQIDIFAGKYRQLGQTHKRKHGM